MSAGMREAEGAEGRRAEIILDALLSEPDPPGLPGWPKAILERMIADAGAPGAGVRRAAFARALLARLERSSDLNVRVFALRALSWIGREESVPALSALLSDPDPLLREHALRALERNPTAEASAALRAALGAADSTAWRVAVIEAIGGRRDEGALEALAAASVDPEEEVAAAALLAIGAIGSSRAAEILSAALAAADLGGMGARRRTVIERASLLCADVLFRSGAKEAARALLARVRDGTSSPLHREASRRGLDRCGS